MIENWLAKKPREGKKKKPENARGGLTRRKFIENALYATVGAYYFFNAGGLVGLLRKELEKYEADDHSTENPTKEQKEIEQQNIEVIGKTVEQQLRESGRVILNSETKKAIYQKWLD